MGYKCQRCKSSEREVYPRTMAGVGLCPLCEKCAKEWDTALGVAFSAWLKSVSVEDADPVAGQR